MRSFLICLFLLTVCSGNSFSADKRTDTEIKCDMFDGGWFSAPDVESVRETLCKYDSTEQNEGRDDYFVKKDAFSLKKEIECLVQFQNKYTREIYAEVGCRNLRETGERRTGLTGDSACTMANEAQKCIYSLADRRRRGIEDRSGNVDFLKCFSVDYKGSTGVLCDNIILDQYKYSYRCAQDTIKNNGKNNRGPCVGTTIKRQSPSGTGR